ncbi:MAG: hypothetical protein AB1941_06645 [Gemmatimonadota bacterium]
MPPITLRPLLAAALLALAAASPASAQRAAPPLSALRVPVTALAPAAYQPALPQSGPRTDGAGMAFAGLAGGAAGLLGGALLGYVVETGLTGCAGEEWCGFRGVLLGGVVGEVTMLPLGVHLANRGRGSYGSGVAATALVGVGALLVAAGMGDAVPATALLVPAAQLAAAVAVEKSTARKKLRGQD